MARTLINAIAAEGNYPSTGVSLSTLTAADVANQNYTPGSGKDLILAYNSDVSTHHVTVLSANDAYGRKGDITSEAIAAGEFRTYGPFPKSGWTDSSGNLNYGADNAAVKFAVIQLP